MLKQYTQATNGWDYVGRLVLPPGAAAQALVGIEVKRLTGTVYVDGWRMLLNDADFRAAPAQAP